MSIGSEQDATALIARPDMMELMLRACPSFRPAYDEFLKEWSGQDEELPQYLALTDLARHLAAMLVNGETAEFGQIFDVIERWHQHGDAYVREAATIGLLEDLQNVNLWPNGNGDRARFEVWLRPISLRYWRKLIDFWETGVVIADD